MKNKARMAQTMRYSLKFNLAMKLTAILLLVSVFSINANTYSQKAKVTCNLKNVKITRVFEKIEKDTNFKFLYKNNEIDENRLVSLNVTNEPLVNILNDLFLHTNIVYVVKRRQIILKEDITEKFVKHQNHKNEKQLVKSLQQQISGTITSSEDGFVIPGVNIIVKGTANGTASDFDGNYQINASSGDILVFSYIGYKTIEKTVTSITNLNVVMEPDAEQLDDVVVIGYGSVKKSDVTGALTSVSSKDFDKQPLNDVSQALQGRASGVQVTQTSGAPGGSFKIRIRGANSITGSNEPLYVVDGQFVDISTVNVNDIQSMEVLKDASSTAIYGTRGANGVVLITTKKGRIGKAKINVDLFTGTSTVTQKLDLLSPVEFAEGVNFSEGRDPNDPNNPFYTTAEIDALRLSGGEDWQKRLFKTAFFNNAQISASGGTKDVDYYISGNLYETEGTVVDQKYKRLNLRTNFNANLNEKLKVGVNFNIGRVESKGNRADLGVGLAFDPTTTAFNEDGEYNFNSTKQVSTSQTNPLVAVENNIRENTRDRYSINGYVNYDLAKNLVFNSSAGIVKTEVHNNTYAPLISSSIGRANVDNTSFTNLFNTNRLTYSVDIGEKSSLKIDAIHEFVKENRSEVEVDASDFFTDLVSFKNLSAAAVQIVSNEEQNRELESFLGRVNYSLLDKYLFTASLRADGTSVFQKNKWGYFPSASFAWKISEEQFIQNVESINNLKLRLSYGQVGNQGISVFGTRSRAILDEDINYPFSGNYTVGVAPSNRLANPDLTWETTEQINAGLDIGLWNSGLTMSIDYYKKNTTDLLLDTQLPSFVGPTNKFVNAGEVENKGFEVTLGARILQNDNWSINSTLSFSSNRNKVLSLNDDVQFIEVGDDIRANTFPVKPTRVEVGLPISSFRGYIFDGVYQLGEEAEGTPGNAKYRDISGPDGVPDGIISTDDITTIGDGNADYTWGWNWDVNYKNWNLNFVLTGSQGNDIYNLQRARLMALGAQQFHAVYGDYRDRWTPTNPSNIPSGRDGTEILSSQFIEDGSYITMKNIALSYNVNSNFLDKLGLSKLRLYTSVENLFIITDYTGFDPEATASGADADADVGIDYNSYPINRSVTLGLNVSF
ncbi:TonB-dependent receptor [uncultured Maribacter sp.]|uniref:TonB-dependent receptor n=1 Tax=uncultured Maribacter sp. TaxID=431308 RepID=UPI002615BE1C|nr:TonB-dependent receptor [uncultured Maribacter sp.]